MKIVIENVSDGENIPHNILLIRGRVDNLDSSLLEGNIIKISMFLKVYKRKYLHDVEKLFKQYLVFSSICKKNYIISMPEVVM